AAIGLIAKGELRTGIAHPRFMGESLVIQRAAARPANSTSIVGLSQVALYANDGFRRNLAVRRVLAKDGSATWRSFMLYPVRCKSSWGAPRQVRANARSRSPASNASAAPW